MSKGNSIRTVICSYARPAQAVTIAKDEITMTLATEPRRVVASAGMMQQFANAEQERDIVRCLHSYGPLTTTDEPRPAGIYRFPLWIWRGVQAGLRENWKLSECGKVNKAKIFTQWPVGPGDTMRFNERTGELEYCVRDLDNLLQLFLLAQPAERFKLCMNPECKTPYLLTNDSKVKLCKTCRKSWNNARHQREHRAKLGKQ